VDRAYLAGGTLTCFLRAFSGSVRARTVAGMTAITDTTTRLSPVGRLNALGLAVAAAGIMIQFVAGVGDYPTIPPGPIVLLAAAAVVVFGPWRRAVGVGLAAALFISIGGVIATIAGNGYADTLGSGEVGGVIGALIQIAGLALAVPAGILAVRAGRRTS
jgi:hypothetical protein